MKNQVKCTLPLGPKEFKILMMDKEVEFLIDIANSEKLPSPKAQIAFLANANVPGRIDFKSEALTDEILEEFIVEWMLSGNIIDIKPIKNIVAKIILFTVGGRYQYIPVPSRINDDFLKRFVEKNIEVIEKWVLFLDSTFSVFIDEFYKKTAEELEVYQYEGTYPVHEDRNFIGKNVALLYSVENFAFFYCEEDIPFENRVFFKYQFLDYMWRNNHFSAYFCVPENTMIYIYSEARDMMDDGEFDKIVEEYREGLENGQLPSE